MKRHILTLLVLSLAFSLTAQASELPESWQLTLPPICPSGRVCDKVSAADYTVLRDAVIIEGRISRNEAELLSLNSVQLTSQLEPRRPALAASKQDKTWNWKMYALAGGVIASSAADWRSTRTALTRCPTCREANPIAAPFAKSDTALSAFKGGTAALSIWGGARLKAQGKSWWWIPMVAKIGLDSFAAWRNWGIGQHCAVKVNGVCR